MWNFLFEFDLVGETRGTLNHTICLFVCVCVCVCVYVYQILCVSVCDMECVCFCVTEDVCKYTRFSIGFYLFLQSLKLDVCSVQNHGTAGGSVRYILWSQIPPLVFIRVIIIMNMYAYVRKPYISHT